MFYCITSNQRIIFKGHENLTTGSLIFTSVLLKLSKNPYYFINKWKKKEFHNCSEFIAAVTKLKTIHPLIQPSFHPSTYPHFIPQTAED